MCGANENGKTCHAGAHPGHIYSIYTASCVGCNSLNDISLSLNVQMEVKVVNVLFVISSVHVFVLLLASVALFQQQFMKNC